MPNLGTLKPSLTLANAKFTLAQVKCHISSCQVLNKLMSVIAHVQY